MGKIIIKRSSVAARVPLPSDLDVGELAVNLADKKLFSKDVGGAVITLSGTVNSPDATLLSRANHTGTQTASTISDFAAEVAATALQSWTTSGRPASPGYGRIGANTTRGCLEWWNGTHWVPDRAIKLVGPHVMTGTTALDVTGIEPWVNEIWINLDFVGFANTTHIGFRLGSGSVDSGTSYHFNRTYINNANASVGVLGAGTNAWFIYGNGATVRTCGDIVIRRGYENRWTMSGNVSDLGAGGSMLASGIKTLAGELDRVQIFSGSGSTFSSGAVSVTVRS